MASKHCRCVYECGCVFWGRVCVFMLSDWLNSDPWIFLVSHVVASRNLPSCNPATANTHTPPIPHPHSVTHVNLSGPASWHAEQCRHQPHKKKKPTCAALSIFPGLRVKKKKKRKSVGVIRLIQELICRRGVCVCMSLPGCSQRQRSITYRKLINTSILLLVPAKNAELCACQDYLSVNETRRHPHSGAVH